MSGTSPLTPAERRDIVLSLLRGEATVQDLATQYEVSEATLHRWRSKFLAGGEAALAGERSQEFSDRKRIQELEQEVSRRAQVIGELTMQLKRSGEAGAR